MARNKNKRRGKRPMPKEEEGRQYQDSPVKDTERNNTFGGNSIEWYSRYPNLLLAAGQIQYPYKPGMRIPLGNIKKSIAADAQYTEVNIGIPGVYTLRWRPSVGYSYDNQSPASIVGVEMYAKVREKFSGAIDADPPDFVIYLMALDSIFSYIAHLKRLYRLINAYSPENYATPKGLLLALGLQDEQVEDLRKQKMELFSYINQLIYMVRKFRCPRVMDLFNRHVWLNDHVYTDAPTIKAQFYMFVQTHWYQFAMLDVPDVTPTVQAGGLTQKQLKYPDAEIAYYLFEFGREMIDALAASDDGYQISGYLMKAYEGYPSFYVDELLLSEQLVPKYNEEVLGEIENAHSIPGGYSSIDLTVYQNPDVNAIVCNPSATYPVTATAVKRRFDGIYPRYNSRMDNPTIADTIVNSRMMSYIGNFAIGSDSATALILACTEVITGLAMVAPTDNPALGRWEQYLIGSEYLSYVTGTPNLTAEKGFFAALMSTQWDWAPMIYAIEEFPNGTSWSTLIGDLHNVTTSTFQQLRHINEVCLFSLFNAFSV